jgi:hypothetical protein
MAVSLKVVVIIEGPQVVELGSSRLLVGMLVNDCGRNLLFAHELNDIPTSLIKRV